MRIAIFLGGSFGDILNATPVAKKLKELNHHITWYVSTTYQSALIGNPHIDKQIFFQADSKDDCIIRAYRMYEKLINSREYDMCAALSPSIIPEWNSDAHISLAICMAANRQLQMHTKFVDGWTPILRLTDNEIGIANSKAAKVKDKKTILFECCPESHQSGISPECINKMAEYVISKGWLPIISVSPDCRDLFKKNIWAPNLTLREMVHFYRYVNIFVSCSSGLAVAASSDHNEGIQHPHWIEFVNSEKICSKPIGRHIEKDVNYVPISEIFNVFVNKFNQIIG